MTWDGLLLDARLATLRPELGPYGAIVDAAIGWKDGRIVFAGPRSELPDDAVRLAARVRSAEGRWITPGLIDCHTHLVFAGTRAPEFERRLQGVSYELIAREGGGILSTVTATRACSEDELFAHSLPRARALMADGVVAIEIKSGYGLDLPSERRMLRVARRLGLELGITISTTYLAAHALPPEFAGRADEYVSAVCEWMKQLHSEGLIDSVDAFCEKIGFSPAQTRRVFEAAQALGLPVKLHADQLSDLGGAALSAEFRAWSADHVEFTGVDAVRAMADAGTVAVLLPGAFHVLRDTQLPPIAAFRHFAVPMAVATDLNPGTSPLQSLRLAMSLACTHFKLTPEEALRGATVHAARALGWRDRGELRVGQRADFVQWRIGHPAELSYWLGGDLVEEIHLA